MAGEPVSKTQWRWKSGHWEEGYVAYFQYFPTSHEGGGEALGEIAGEETHYNIKTLCRLTASELLYSTDFYGR